MIILSVKKIKRIIFFLLVISLFYTRFANLSWGLPYPFHPDERNMAQAIAQLHCKLFDLKDCFNPHFFAYGQFPLYLGYGMAYILRFFSPSALSDISFKDAALALRIVSAAASVMMAYFVVKIVQILNYTESGSLSLFIPFLAVVFSPALIQFAHFGTTESLLMLFYIWLVYESLLLMRKKITPKHFLLIASIVSGLALATKASALIFMAPPVATIIYYHRNKFYEIFKSLSLYFLLSMLVGVFFSPHNLISFNEFIGTLSYESAVALGTLPVFYTRQFAGTIPILFQFVKIFPYALGWPILLSFILGFFVLPIGRQENLLRFSFLIYFLSNAFLYAKWSRFMAPAMPLIIVIAVLTLIRFSGWLFNTVNENLNEKSKIEEQKMSTKNFLHLGYYCLILVITFSFIIPGMAYLSVYAHQDVRFTASDWINGNIRKNSIILSETANVVDIPVTNPNNDKIISFNFYDLDTDRGLQQELKQDLQKADYIFIPSRRIFMNHPKEKYPLLSDYYSKLFSGSLGFNKVAEFTAYPEISFLGQTLLKFPDERAEETWSVFDHPVIRIYQK